jgi:hypothetical protein
VATRRIARPDSIMSSREILLRLASCHPKPINDIIILTKADSGNARFHRSQIVNKLDETSMHLPMMLVLRQYSGFIRVRDEID